MTEKTLGKERRSLKKIGEGLFELEIVNDEHRLVTKKVYEVAKLREIYEELADQRNSALSGLRNANKALEDLKGVDDTEELRNFLRLANLAQQLQRKQEQERVRDSNLSMIDECDKQMKEISLVVPEVVRNK